MKDTNLGVIPLSKLIAVLEKLKDDLGDVNVVGAYDGNWGEDVHIVLFEDVVIIGSIS